MSKTVLHRLALWAKETPNVPAQRYKIKGVWKSISAKEYFERVYYLALFFESQGIGAGDTGAILSYNCPEWVHTDLAVLLLGAKSAGLYPNSTSNDIAYVLNHTEARVLGVQNKDYFKKITAENEVPKSIRLILVFDGDTSISPMAVSYSDAVAQGKKLSEKSGCKTPQDFLTRLDPLAGAFMIYTSGTTGNPKGALLSHDNLTFTSDTVAKLWDLPMAKGSMISFLPLCHIAEKVQSIGVGICQRYTVSFCTKFDALTVELPEVQPTLLLSVPRLWEKMMEGVMSKITRSKGVKKYLALWALGVGERAAATQLAGKSLGPVDQIQLKLANQLVLSKVRAALGLQHASLLASGAAPLPAQVSKWFRIFGLEINECFGMTESTGVLCLTLPGVDCAGTVGKPVSAFEFKLADDGEILSKGRHVFVGYFKDEASTALSLQNGWLHTGDLGEWTDQGLMRIRGRKREIMKTSGGKMIAPAPIEERIKTAAIISQVCMVGDNRKYLSVLITLSEAIIADVQSKSMSKGGVVTDKKLLKEVSDHLEEINKSLAGFEQIKKFAVIDREFSIESGEMTPTLKMKRSVIENRFKTIIDSLYT